MMEIPDHFHFVHKRRVEFSDTDLAGIVHFANYFRYVESAEHAFWRSLGKTVHTITNDAQHGWPRLNVVCNYFRPARFEQILCIGLRIEKVGNTTIRYGFYISDEKDPDVLVASGEATIIHVAIESNSGRMAKAPIPGEVRKQLEHLL